MPENFTPDLEDFTGRFNAGKSQILATWITGDLETPVSAYQKLCERAPYCFLLESVEGGKTLGRYSIIGLDPDLILKCDGQDVSIWNDYGSWEQSNDPPIESLRKAVQESAVDYIPDNLPPMADSGLFGYFGYDMIRLIEDLPDNNDDDLQIPDSIMVRPTILAIFDNIKNMICLLTPVHQHADNTKSTAKQIYTEATKRLEDNIKKLEKPIPKALLSHATNLSTPLEISSTMEKQDYIKAVEKAIEYIHQGEIFQVVPGQRFSVDFDIPAFELYRALRRLNPSPFMFHLAFDDFAIVGSSPEILVRVRDDTVTIRPIAGTRKRGQTAEEDKALADNLLADEKERAEHLMLLDLGRNDVGRVAEFGSVKVTEEFKIEYYSHVMHIVSNVEGKLREDYDIVDALFAGFPAGTVSGAPKIRAMEIIDELETSRRSYYGGGVGYLSGHGEMDTCIALRTALVKDGRVHVQAGAGIVADSDPESEYEETVNKAKAIIQAAEMALAQAQK